MRKHTDARHKAMIERREHAMEQWMGANERPVTTLADM